jgi:hypothetical protein
MRFSLYQPVIIASIWNGTSTSVETATQQSATTSLILPIIPRPEPSNSGLFANEDRAA